MGEETGCDRKEETVNVEFFRARAQDKIRGRNVKDFYGHGGVEEARIEGGGRQQSSDENINLLPPATARVGPRPFPPLSD